KYLLLNDTASFAVYLTALRDTMEHRIYFRDSVGNEIMEFTPADSPENNCEIVYQPQLIDGLYALRVQAKDISANESGDNDYYITFRVVSDPSITNVYTYPNPFSTGTHFVFNLTGIDVPEWFYIQIFDAQGKLVKTINLNEVENVHIGPNYTDYAWDATNDQGGKVGPGLYIYQITVKLKGDNMPHAEHPMDGYLQRAYGKMIFVR
ncbi:MAG: T9SS type A sorting domain-containing protein, partial [Bacteroidales bacterium]|nr:T9SS type A sorting domain-containing protein [Bacteroidales bacterium]